ncbi:ABC transporter substrate-binding protein [Salinibius halmophilus]|uniref:ABC transporter substrate-binding protein n=1 Tax=Salinibius halmophilus TaxID=1853216 RepID=UPI0013148487|nr:helical backbone metal receptor [Salinibius halmophilus]
MKTKCIALFAGLILAGQALAVTLVDGLGNTVTLEQPAKRIVSLVPSATEVLFEVGAGDLIVGAVEWSNYPEAAKAIPRVGNSSKINTEAVLALNPDLIIWGWRNDQVDQLEGMGIQTLYMKPETFTGIELSLRNAGIATGKEAAAQARIEEFSSTIAALRAEYANKAPVRTFYQISPTAPIYTVNNISFLHAIMEVCGAENVFADTEGNSGYPPVSLEAVVEAAPDAIVMAARDDSFAEVWQGLTSIPAVASQQFVKIAPDDISRPVPGLVKGATQMCEQLDEFR